MNSTPMQRALTFVVTAASFVALTLVAQPADAQSLSLTGGMTLLVGPPEGQPPPVLGAPQDGTPPQGQQPQTVYIVETQAPPGYGQPGYGQPGYGQPGAMSATDVAAQRAQQESDGRIPRLIFEPIMGYTTAVLLGSLGLLVGGLAGCFDVTDRSCVLGIVAGFYVGALLGVPLGVMWAGSWFHGMGSFGLTFLGALAGASLSVLIAALAQNYDAIFGAALLPVAGAMIAYELSSSSNASAGTATLALTPTFDRGAMTGATAGVRVAF